MLKNIANILLLNFKDILIIILKTYSFLMLSMITFNIKSKKYKKQLMILSKS